MWWCKCDCGNEKAIDGHSINRGKTSSCGCLRKELLVKNSKIINKKYNTYDLTKDYGIGYTSKGKEFYFDLDDYDKIKDYCWNYDFKKYVITTYNSRVIRMHRLVMDCTNPHIIIDHINHIKYDNRKTNLRHATIGQNNINVKTSKRNTSGFKGVYWDKRDNVWIATIQINKKKTIIYRGNNKNDAIEERIKYEKIIYGEFNYDRKLDLKNNNMKLKDGVNERV